MLAQTGTVSLTSIVVGVPRGLGDPQRTFLEVLQIMLIIILVQAKLVTIVIVKTLMIIVVKMW